MYRRESIERSSRDGHTAVATRFRALLEGDHDTTAALYTEDALLDVNVPGWRFQHQGVGPIRHQLDEWHPFAPEIVEWHELTTERGLLVEVALWEGEGHRLYCRSQHALEITSGRISRHTMYCTGDWAEESLAEASAALIDA